MQHLNWLDPDYDNSGNVTTDIVPNPWFLNWDLSLPYSTGSNFTFNVEP